MVEIIYPTESSFYPYALILLIIIVAMVISIMIFFIWVRQKTKIAFLLNIENHISLATLIVTVGVVFIPFFVQTPILDYSVQGPFSTDLPKIIEMKVNLNNYGIVPAKNVIISMNTNSDEVQFLEFASNPLLSESDVNENTTNQTEKAIFKIEVLPPRSENIITARVTDNITRTDVDLVTYLRSDETVGNHDTLLTFIVYMAVLSVVVPLAIGKIKPWNWITKPPS